MAALGAAMLLITRTLEPQSLYKEVDWGLLVFFVGLFLIVGGAENAGITHRLLELAQHRNLQRVWIFTISVAGLCNMVNNVPAVMLLKIASPRVCRSTQSLVDAGHGLDSGGQPHDLTVLTLIVGCAWLSWAG
jgi:Na+/H+ antiporter NhaD/arsenite permease-like protein